MSNNVVSINPPKAGEESFVLCPCDPEGVQPLVQCLFVNGQALITGILCPECETFSPVENGFIKHDQP